MTHLQIVEDGNIALSNPPKAPPAAAATSLTLQDKEHFLIHGWVKLSNCFTPEQAEWVTSDVWTRLGMDPRDKTTWTSLRTNMPHHRIFDVAKLSPKIWSAICEVCGGEDRVNPSSREWRDSLIVNLGAPEFEDQPTKPQELTGWHVDGDFFVHYLDSREQGLLVIPLFTDIHPDGGGTVICPEAISHVARWLYDHPEGVSPRMVPRGEADFSKEKNLDWFNNLAKRCTHFVEATGTVGDVYLLHPLMLHSASNNSRRMPRIITNPPVFMNAEFRFDRGDGEDGEYSLVERHTLRALGKDDLKGWKITGPREGIVPERVRIQERMKREEIKRLEEARKISVAA
jgi:hypothetical protein